MTIQPFEGKQPRIGEGAFIAENAFVLGDVEIGAESGVWYGAVVRGDVSSIHIGSMTNIQDCCVVHVTGGAFATSIGDRVTVGHGAIIHGCTVGSDCLIGMGAILLDGVDVPDGCVVAAGALLPPGRRYEPGTLIVGSPAEARRPATPAERAWIASSAEIYRELAKRHAAALIR